MKRFVVRQGHYTGTHYIYDSPEEARKTLGKDLIILDWETVTPDECDDGTWMHLTDGTVAQLLYRRRLHLTPAQLKVFGNMPARFAMRFAFLTVPMWYRKRTDDWARGRVLGQPNLDSTRMTPNAAKYVLGKTHKKDEQIAMKLAFAQFILLGKSPRDAIHAVITLYETRFVSNLKVDKLRNAFMSDELVSTTIINGVAPFKELLARRFPEEQLANELQKLLESSRPGTMSHRENLKFILELTGLYSGEARKPLNKKQEAETIPFEDISPPQ